MANLLNNNLMQEDEEKEFQTGAGTQTQGASSGIVSGSGAGNGQPNAGVAGAGGTGWTNIQSYLNANKGGTGSEKFVQDKVGSQFGTEKSAIQKAGDETKSGAQAQVAGVKDAADNSKKWIDESAKNYNWNGAQSQDYYNSTNKLRGAANGQYAGPTQYNYDIGENTQRYGAALGDNKAFSGLMDSFYKDAAGGQISRGGLDLQQQLDVNNDNLASTRQNLLKDYAGLGTLRDQTATEAGGAIEQARNQYGVEQNRLRDGLANYGTETDTARARAEADASKAYRDATYADGSQNATEFQDSLSDADRNYMGRTASSFGANSIGKMQDFFDGPSTWGSNENRDTVKKHYDSTMGDMSTDNVSRILKEFDEYYGKSRDQYAATGQPEKQKFNTIMDILGNSARADEKFDVVKRDKNAWGV